MPVVQQQNPAGSFADCTTTVQDILNCASQDVRGVLSANVNTNNGIDVGILTDYTNRVSLDLLRFSRWQFLLSPVYKFVTQLNVTDYWIGTPGAAPTDYTNYGIIDTLLNVQNMQQIKRDSFYDRSNATRLSRTDNAPLGYVYTQNSKPKNYRNDPESPQILNVYPPSNYGSLWTYSSVTRVNNISTLTINGSVNNDFQTNLSDNLIWIQGDADTSYNGYWPIQQVAGQVITFWNPGANSTSSAGGTASSGYTIEFRYYQDRVQLTAVNQILQIPDDYKDIVCAGVVALAFSYLQKPEEAQAWQAVYREGRTQMVKDKNAYQAGEDFVRPDYLAVMPQTVTGLGLDSGLETSIP
jgi:hypothetical protein